MARKNATAKRVARKKDTRPAKRTARRLTVIEKAKPKPPPEPEAPKVEISVRRVYHEDQWTPALCFRYPGAPLVPAVVGDPIAGVRLIRVTGYHHDKCSLVPHGPGPYPVPRFLARMRELARVAITPEARTLLLPHVPDIASGPDPATLPPSDPAARPVAARAPSSKAPVGPSRTSGKELIRTLAEAAKLPPEKVRAKLRASGLRAPYVDEQACRKALGLGG